MPLRGVSLPAELTKTWRAAKSRAGKTKEPARTIIAEAVEGLETHGERIEAAQDALVEHGAAWNDLGWLKKKRAEAKGK